VDSAYLFGSHAKGTSNQWSDIDLAIVSPDFSEDLYEERLILMRLAAEIDDRIEPKPFRPEMFTPNEPLVDEIQKHGLKLRIISESVVASLENFQGKVAQVVKAVSFSFNDFDLVIDPFQKAGMDGVIAVV